MNDITNAKETPMKAAREPQVAQWISNLLAEVEKLEASTALIYQKTSSVRFGEIPEVCLDSSEQEDLVQIAVILRKITNKVSVIDRCIRDLAESIEL